MEKSLKQSCPFCRERLPNDEDEADLNTIRRVEANDPVTTHEMGMNHYIDGGYGSSFNTISKMQPSWAMWNLSAAATIIAVAADDGTGRRMVAAATTTATVAYRRGGRPLFPSIEGREDMVLLLCFNRIFIF